MINAHSAHVFIKNTNLKHNPVVYGFFVSPISATALHFLILEKKQQPSISIFWHLAAFPHSLFCIQWSLKLNSVT